MSLLNWSSGRKVNIINLPFLEIGCKVNTLCRNSQIIRMLFLFVMIWLTLDDGAGTVELFGEDESYHLVGEREARQGYLFVGPLIDGRGEAVGASDDEHQSAGILLLLLKPASQFYTTVFVAVFIKQHHMVGRLQLLEDELSFGDLLLFLGEVLRVAQLGNGDDVKGHVMTDAFGIVIDACREMLVDGFPDL